MCFHLYSKSKFSQNTTNLLSIKVTTLIEIKLVVLWLNLIFEYLRKNTSGWLQFATLIYNKLVVLWLNLIFEYFRENTSRWLQFATSIYNKLVVLWLNLLFEY